MIFFCLRCYLRLTYDDNDVNRDNGDSGDGDAANWVIDLVDCYRYKEEDD